MRGAPKHSNLRAWRDEDLAPFIALHADPDVGYWLGGPWGEEKARTSFEQARRTREDGLGAWPITDGDGELVGVGGLARVTPGLPVYPAVEAAWRLLPRARGCGIATSSMRPILARGFEIAGLDRIVAFTARCNERSTAMMRRLGFVATPKADFDHPALPETSPLKAHVVYVLERSREATC